MTATATAAVYRIILDTYLASIHDRALVLEALQDGEGSVEVIYELCDLTWRLGYRSDKESDADADAWWDAMAGMLPDIASRLLA